ncbi:hypothetical protein [Streptomyces sp. Je 1-369]|uniref:hypothetical protein n=1 Tax=Streptomyces sp. Je 1-369 TaxID=2966192 RepID=UPI0022862A30|nr:hypothetical protein [Streptomyces sp. Je 1-369]WAL98479.1 hypothetical protein NOO62_30730 [Streptomyces sp. Je 1-369]
MIGWPSHENQASRALHAQDVRLSARAAVIRSREMRQLAEDMRDRADRMAVQARIDLASATARRKAFVAELAVEQVLRRGRAAGPPD